MADINQQTEELARKFEQLTQAMNQYDQVTKSSVDQKRDADVQAATGIKNFTAGANKGADAVAELAGAAMSAGKAMLEGKKGAAAFNESIDGLTKAATAAGVALTLLVPGGAIIKGVVAGFTAVTAATAAMVKASNEMADKIYKGYAGLSKSGAAASDGMTGVFNDAKKLGLSMNELDQLVGLVGENSRDLALFSGSVYEGRKQFADMGKAMEPYRKQMLAAGYTQEEINQAAMGYLKLQTRLSQSQRGQVQTGDQLAQGAKKYFDELDALTKLTGQSRKETEDQRKAALMEEQFRAKIRQMELSGDREGAERLRKYNDLMTAINPAMAAGIRALASGNIAAEEAQKVLLTSNGQAAVDLEKVMAGVLPLAEAADSTTKAIGDFSDGIGVNLALLKANDQSFLKFSDQQDIRIAREKGFAETLRKIEQDQIDQGLKGGKGADAVTQQYAETIKKQQELNEKFERTVFAGISNALAVTDRLADATDVLATGFEKLGTAVNRLLNIVGLGVKETKVEAKAKEVSEAKSGHIKAMEAQKLAVTPEEKAAADREIKFYRDKVNVLEQEKEILAKQDKNAQLDKEILKRSSDDLKLKKSAYDKAMETASVKQKLGFGLDKDQQKARDELRAAEMKNLALVHNASGARDKARAEAAAKQPSPPTAGAGRGTQGGAGAPTPPAPAAPAVPTSVEQLKEAGLTVKEGDVQQEGAVINPKTIELAKAIQGSLKGFGYFSGFNDKFHNENSPTSEHTKGNALDFVMQKRPTPAEGKEITSLLKSMGARVAIDEYNSPSAKSTGGHIHAAVPGYADGGIAKTPQLAFVAEKGPEAMIPLVDGAIPIKLTGDMFSKSPEAMPDIDSMFRKITSSMKDVNPVLDSSPLLSNISSTMFAAIESLKSESIDSGFDRNMRQEVVEPEVAASKSTVDLPAASVARESSSIMEFIKEAKEANFAMLNMISELVREQRNANDISTRILQVSSN
jgi:hypothetical protein